MDKIVLKLARQVLCGLVFIAFFSCGNEKSAGSDFDWLVGSWERMNDSEGQQTFETWEKQNESEYRGLGYTLQGKDTVFKENIKMIRKEHHWVFEVTGVNESATPFQVTQHDENSFMAENANNPFPKKIVYKREEEYLNAFVSAEETSIKFRFQSMK